MKRACIHIACFILSLSGNVSRISAQSLADSDILNASLFRERFYLHTDRNLYAAGDPIRFRAFNLSHVLLKENNWSTVLYLEMINPRQTPVARGKFKLEPEGSSGQLTIPDTLSTGIYYLRVYTRWMRNFPASEYTYVQLAVVNPARINQAEQVHTTTAGRDSLAVGHRTPELREISCFDNEGLHCQPGRSSYGRREKVEIKVDATDKDFSPGGYAISVVRKDHIDGEGSCFSGLVTGSPRVPGPVRFTPETRGVSVEGNIVEGEEQQPVPYARMHLTLLGAEPDYFSIVSDRNGTVSFSVPPHTGANNALITFDSQGSESYQFVEEDPFSEEYLTASLPAPDYFTNRREVLEELMIYTQVKQNFGIPGTGAVILPDSLAEAFFFYGSPDYRYSPATYIPIPVLEEFFFELVAQVAIKKEKGEYKAIVMDDNHFPLLYSPLILLDHVIVQDMEAFLGIDPRLINFIDVVNSNYTRGSNIYGGIISVISKEGNLAGAGLPEGSTIIDLQTFKKTADNLPQEYCPPSADERIPDLRTLLYWEPQLQIPEGGETVLEFQSSDIGGTYRVLIKGLNSDGLVVRGMCEFTVE